MFAIAATVYLAFAGVLTIGDSRGANTARAAPLQTPPTPTLVDPASASNDLDTRVLITGSNFIATPFVLIGNTPLNDVTRVSATLLEATVPWGLAPGVYDLTVENPGGESGTLAQAFTVTEGIGVWNATALYGGSVERVSAILDACEITVLSGDDSLTLPMMSVGAKGVILVGETTDPFSVETVRATMGSVFAVPVAKTDAAGFLQWRKGFPGLVVGTHLKGAVDYRSIDYGARPVLLLMGNEQQGLPDDSDQLFIAASLLHIIIGTLFHRVDRCFPRGVGGHQDNNCIRPVILDRSEKFNAVDFGHPQIGNDQVVRRFTAQVDRFFRPVGNCYLVSLFGQHDGQKLPHLLIIIQHQDLRHRTLLL